MKTVLFLCSGNYYRSRFAELFFEWTAKAAALRWKARSRGLWLNCDNMGPISPDAARALEGLGVQVPRDVRFPLEAVEEDLLAADLVIAVHEREHRPMIESRFPAAARRVEYWQVPDLDGAAPHAALAELAVQVRGLAQRLSAAPATPSSTPR
ncbi:MAG: low molecular weight phosphatase family protein [Elusimicrobiota bacterium]